MAKPHKHAQLIKAWADGAEIEMWTGCGWSRCGPDWLVDAEYRVKPTKKQIWVRVIEWYSDRHDKTYQQIKKGSSKDDPELVNTRVWEYKDRVGYGKWVSEPQLVWEGDEE